MNLSAILIHRPARSDAQRCRLTVLGRLAWVTALLVFRLSGQSALADSARLNNLGAQLFSSRSFAEAERTYRAALESAPADSLARATIWHNLAVLMMRQHRYGDAEILYQKALDQKRKILAPLDPEVAVTLNELGLACESGGQYQRAGAHFEDAIRILETSRPDSRDLADVMNNLSVIDRLFKRNERAGRLLRKALEIKERAVGPDSPEVGVLLNNLSKALEKDATVTAAALYSRAIEIFELCGRDCVQNLAIALANAGSLMASEKRYGDAEATERRALELLEGEESREESLIAFVLYNLGNLYSSQKRFEEAQRSFEQCLSIEKKLLREDHPLLIDTLRSYSALLRHMGRKAEARQIDRRADVLVRDAARKDPMDFIIDVATLKALRQAREL